MNIHPLTIAVIVTVAIWLCLNVLVVYLLNRNSKDRNHPEE